MTVRRRAVLGVVWTAQAVALLISSIVLTGLVCLAVLDWLEHST